MIASFFNVFIWSGILGCVLGSLVGVWITFRFQKILLQQQLDFQKELFDQQQAAQEKAHKEHLAFLDKCSDWDCTRGVNLRGAIDAASQRIAEALNKEEGNG